MTLENLLSMVKDALSRTLSFLIEGSGDAEALQAECSALEHACVAHRDAAFIHRAIIDGLGAACDALENPDIPADLKVTIQELIRVGLAEVAPVVPTPGDSVSPSKVTPMQQSGGKKKSVIKEVRRNGVHPCSQNPGFDFLYLWADTAAELDVAMDAAERKFWKTWTAGVKPSTGLAGAVMYKPCDASEPWEDSPENPHPGCPRSNVTASSAVPPLTIPAKFCK